MIFVFSQRVLHLPLRSESDFIVETLIKSALKAHQSLMSSPTSNRREEGVGSSNGAGVSLDGAASIDAAATPATKAAATPSYDADKLDRLLALISTMISFKEGALVTPTQITNLQNLFSQVCCGGGGKEEKERRVVDV